MWSVMQGILGMSVYIFYCKLYIDLLFFTFFPVYSTEHTVNLLTFFSCNVFTKLYS